ncbi:formin-1 isoform X1 [Heterocephalus glaber]|uniref:Formin-1 isoform X1 n=1 Tax=Heterocephalus glaber TaxID=10181 RepID=A0AAX6RLT3_HETGA|nr:formin-1 isoform X1 [Heterocephalus glaber]
MEGTHCTLRLRKPITELCYISFCLPKGEVRGFSYKGTVILDRSNKGFHNCYQVREESDTISLSQQLNELPGDIFFKPTPTKDILTELYKLTAERERLLADLWSSNHILGISMGNQEGKLLELSMSLAPEDDCSQGAGDWWEECPVGQLNKRSTHGNKKPRRSGGRRESFEVQKRTRRKGRGGQESTPQMGKDQISSSNCLPPSGAWLNLRLLEERGNLVPNGVLTSSLQRREGCPPDIPVTPDADLGFANFQTASEDTGLGRGLLPLDSSATDTVEDGVQEPPRRPHRPEHQQTGLPESQEGAKKHPEAQRGGLGKLAEQTCRKKPFSKVVAKVRGLFTRVQRVVNVDPEREEKIAVNPEVKAEFVTSVDSLTLPGAEAGAHGSRWQSKKQQGTRSLQLPAREKASVSSLPASTDRAVNKVLRKVIESEKLDEATKGQRLSVPVNTRATQGLPETRSKRRTGVPRRGHKSSFVDLPHTIGPDSLTLECRGGERKPSAPVPAAPGMGFNNSSSQSSSHQQQPPALLPLYPRHPSPHQHHRILQLPPPPSERESALNDSPSRQSSIFSASLSADTLEPPSSAKVTETKGASPASLGADQPQLAAGEASEKSVGLGDTTAEPQQPSPPAIKQSDLIDACHIASTLQALLLSEE